MFRINFITVGLVVSGVLLADRAAQAQVVAHREHGETPDQPAWAKEYSTEPQGLEVFIAPCYESKSEIILHLTPENGSVRVDGFQQIPAR